MAKILKDKYCVPDNLEIFQDIYPKNEFDESFGIWPDNMVAFSGKKLIYRGIINLDGSRENNHS